MFFVVKLGSAIQGDLTCKGRLKPKLYVRQGDAKAAVTARHKRDDRERSWAPDFPHNDYKVFEVELKEIKEIV